MKKLVLSIITVCFHAEEQVCRTIESIVCQSWTKFEYLVIDGGSEDGTRELLQSSKSLFDDKGISFRYLSEADQGIYDAMNKGVRMAEGRWLLFLNAGDLLAEDRTLERIFKNTSDEDIIYGDTWCTYQGKRRLYQALPLERLLYEMAFCHQSAFIRRELLLEHPYDIIYKVCADHQFFLSMYLEGRKFEYRPFAISVYEISGYSDRNKMLAHKEQRRMRKELGISCFSPEVVRQEIVFYVKQGIKTVFGQRLVDLVRKKR